MCITCILSGQLFEENMSYFVYRVLKVEVDTYKLRVKALQEENRALRQASVSIVSIFLILSQNLLRTTIFFVADHHISLQ